MRRVASRSAVILAVSAILAATAPSAAMAQDNVWRIVKISGDAWVSGTGSQLASMSQDISIKPGDMIRTGRNGRVLLARGAETILVSPNSAISLPEIGRMGGSTIIQQAGSILLEVEKKNVQHFEVETPYLAAVVKGTRFRVTVANGRSNVAVERGQVQVSDFRSGQFATILPGQAAQVIPAAGSGLKLSGSGMLGQIEQGQPFVPRVMPLAVPRGGLRAPEKAMPLRATGAAPMREAAAPKVTTTRATSANAGISRRANGGLRISAAIGEVKLDFKKVTNGLVGESKNSGSGNGARHGVVGGGPAPVAVSNSNAGTQSSSTAAASSFGSVASSVSVASAGSAAVSQTVASPANTGVSNTGNSNTGNGNSGTDNSGSKTGKLTGKSGDDDVGKNDDNDKKSRNGNGNGNSGNGNRYGYGHIKNGKK